MQVEQQGILDTSMVPDYKCFVQRMRVLSAKYKLQFPFSSINKVTWSNLLFHFQLNIKRLFVNKFQQFHSKIYINVPSVIRLNYFLEFSGQVGFDPSSHLGLLPSEGVEPSAQTLSSLGHPRRPLVGVLPSAQAGSDPSLQDGGWPRTFSGGFPSSHTGLLPSSHLAGIIKSLWYKHLTLI